MKYVLILLISFFSISGFSQVKWETNFKSALAKSKVSHKMVLMECFHPECPHCKVLNKNLETKAIANFINTNYVNVRINLSLVADVRILDDMHIVLPNYPMFLYFNSEGKFVNYLDPQEDLEALKQQLKAEIGQNCESCAMENKQSADRNIKCSTFANISTNFALNNRLSDSLFNKIEREGGQNSLASWVYFSKTVSGMDNTYFKYWISNIPIAAKYQQDAGGEQIGKEKDKFFGIIQKKIIQMNTEKSVDIAALNEVKDAIRKLGAEELMVTIYTWELEIKYLLNNDKYDEAKALLNTISDKYPNAQTSIALFRVINQNTSSNSMNSFFEDKKKATIDGLKTAKEKQQYYEQAAMFYAKDANKKACDEAISAAQLNGMNANELAKLKQACLIK